MEDEIAMVRWLKHASIGLSVRMEDTANVSDSATWKLEVGTQRRLGEIVM